jgi:molybdopterin synthase sulfur carrier subunit
MLVRVKLFASLREAVGAASLDLALPDGATAADAWAALVEGHAALAPRRGSLSAAVNRTYVPFETRLAEGDEVAFIPPVSGG